MTITAHGICAAAVMTAPQPLHVHAIQRALGKYGKPWNGFPLDKIRTIMREAIADGMVEQTSRDTWGPGRRRNEPEKIMLCVCYMMDKERHGD
jgi:hypothetical protein